MESLKDDSGSKAPTPLDNAQFISYFHQRTIIDSVGFIHVLNISFQIEIYINNIYIEIIEYFPQKHKRGFEFLRYIRERNMKFDISKGTDKQLINSSVWMKEVVLRNNISTIYSNPFNPFIILSADHDEVFFFTQTFAQMSGIHPSTQQISNKTLFSLHMDLNSIPLRSYKIFYSSISQPLTSIINNWVEELTHELRTGSLLMDLSHYLMKSVETMDKKVIQRFSQVAYRQKILTIIVTDLIQLLLNPPNIYPVSLTNVLRTSFHYVCCSSNTQFNMISSQDQNDLETSNPEIWASSYFPENIFSSILTWLRGLPITIEVELMNNFSVGISFSIPSDSLLTTLQGFSLVAHYLQFFTSYFNGRLWLTQNSINIILPCVHSE
jgi:hypothetical protein